MKQKVRYRHNKRGKPVVVTVDVDKPIRIGICEACKRRVGDGQINVTALHHWFYKYKNETVKKNPMLALENTNEYCYFGHMIADAIRMLISVKNPEWIKNVLESAPDEVYLRFVEIVDYLNLCNYEKKEKKTVKLK